MNKNNPLGKGISALISLDSIATIEKNKNQVEKVESIDIDKIKINPYQPRKVFSEESIKELSISIAEYGVLQPIIVCKTKNGENFIIIAGERRFRATKKLNRQNIPAIIKDIPETKLLELALIENIQREELNAIDEAKAYCKLIDQFHYTQIQLSQKFGKSRSHIANTIRLLKLPKDIIALIENKSLSASHARTIANSDDPNKLAKKIAKEKLSVREVEKLMQNKKIKTLHNFKNNHNEDHDLKNLEKNIAKKLNVNVKISQYKNNMQILLELNSIDQFDHIIALLSNDYNNNVF